MKFRQLMLVSLGLLSACGGKLNAQAGGTGEMSSPTTWIVDSSKAVCQGVSQQLCLRVRQQSDQFQFMYDPIQGLEYRWGHNYTLAVEQIHSSPTPQDASSVVWHVADILDVTEDALGTRYSYRAVNVADHTLVADGENYRFLGQPFQCKNAELCNALKNVAPTQQIDLEFAYAGEGNIELVEWREAAP